MIGWYHKEYKEWHIFILVDPYNFKMKHLKKDFSLNISNKYIN